MPHCRRVTRHAALLVVMLALLPACRHASSDRGPAYGAYPAYLGNPASASPPQSAPPSSAPPEEQDLAARFASAPALSVQTGKATYYGDSLAGHRTASGERYDPHAFTAAHRKLPFGTVVRVIREPRGPVTYVRITDRGPFGSPSRIIDLSRAAATQLDMIRAGVVSVRLEIVSLPHK